MPHTLDARTLRAVTTRGLCWTFCAWMLFAFILTPRSPQLSYGDFQSWLVYAGVFSVLATAIARVMIGRLARISLWRRYAAGALIGGLTGVAFALGGAAIGSLFVGGARPTLAALAGGSMIVLISSIGAGAVGVAAAVGARPGLVARRRLIESASLVALLIALAWTLPEVAWAFTRDQHLTVVYAHWYPNDSSWVYNSTPIGFEVEDPQHALLPRDLELLKHAGVHGRVVIQASHAVNTVGRPRARMLVLIDGPLANDVRLPQPSRSDILYRQTGTSFNRFPADASVLARSVALSRDQLHSGAISMTVEHAGGATSGGGALDFISRR